MPYERLGAEKDSPANGSSLEPPPPPLLTTTGTAGPAAPVVLYSTPDTSHERFEGRTAVLLGSVQIAGGVFAIAIQAVLMHIQSVATYFGSGVWCAVMYIIAGAFGIAAGKKKSFCLIMTYKVLTITFSVTSLFLFVSAVVALCVDFRSMYHRHGSSAQTYTAISRALNSLHLVIWLVELVCMCWGSVLTCKVTCCAPRQHQAFIAAEVKYVDGQAVIVLGSHAQAPCTEDTLNTNVQNSGGETLQPV